MMLIIGQHVWQELETLILVVPEKILRSSKVAGK